MDRPLPELTLLTGPFGAGKSTWCAARAEEARSGGKSVGGLLSLAVMVDGRKAAIDWVDLAGGTRRRLAWLRDEQWRLLTTSPPSDALRASPSPSPLVERGTGRALAREGGEVEGLVFGDWRFDAETFAWGNRVLHGLPICDLLILDELGPLEFLLGEGLQEGLRLIDERRFPVVCAVVRPELLVQAKERWPWGQVVSLDIDEG